MYTQYTCHYGSHAYYKHTFCTDTFLTDAAENNETTCEPPVIASGTTMNEPDSLPKKKGNFPLRDCQWVSSM